MTQYIDKAAVVAEIEKLRENNCLFDVCAYNVCGELLSFLDTLEVKEVDLKKEIKRWKNEHGVYGMDDLDFIFAKHFFELGLKTRKGE